MLLSGMLQVDATETTAGYQLDLALHGAPGNHATGFGSSCTCPFCSCPIFLPVFRHCLDVADTQCRPEQRLATGKEWLAITQPLPCMARDFTSGSPLLKPPSMC